MYRLLEPIHRRALPSAPTRPIQTESHGLGTAGYHVVAGSLGVDSVVLSFGVGVDTSFEESLLERYHCRIEAFDPTEQAARYVESRSLAASFNFHEVGLGVVDGTSQFADILYPTEDYAVVTTSGLGGHHVSVQTYTTRRLPTIFHDLELDRVDVIKMDIEGSEYSAWPDVLEVAPRVRQIVVEFHPWILNWSGRVPLLIGRKGWRQTAGAIADLVSLGFSIGHVSDRGTEILFVNDSLV